MSQRWVGFAAVMFALVFAPCGLCGERVELSVDTPMPAPAWALYERELLRAHTAACREFFRRYFDERGWLLCVERWGGDDGPDDAIENVNHWPVLHALGGDDEILHMYKKAWEGHLRQYTLAKTTQVPMARDGMYYKEFCVQFDWLHHGEGLTVFNLQGLSDPNDARFRQRVLRYAGFYRNEDPQAPNYDPKRKIIRSLFNGSRGPLLRPATALDWAGDPIEVEHRFDLGHGERTYQEMLDHFKDYNDVVGDHPQNLGATTLALNAYMLTGEAKYKDWLVEYVDAWLERMEKNGGIVPSKIGLDGAIGGPQGKWYGGVYGWGFSVTVPQTGQLAHRNTCYLGLTGFGNALLLTGQQKYVDAWRRMLDAINANRKTIDGRVMYPSMHGDDGWYAFTPQPYSQGALEVYYWSMKSADSQRLPAGGWPAFLGGKDPDFPVRALQRDLGTIREKVEAMRRDCTTPDTRLADDPMKYNPATTDTLVHLTLGGLPPGHKGGPLHCRLRYFDPERRRAGLPLDVAALVDRLTEDEVGVTLVNLSPVSARRVIVQGGAYAEHPFVSTTIGGRAHVLDAPQFAVQIRPGCGARLLCKQRRYANRPTLLHPWDRRP